MFSNWWGHITVKYNKDHITDRILYRADPPATLVSLVFYKKRLFN